MIVFYFECICNFKPIFWTYNLGMFNKNEIMNIHSEGQNLQWIQNVDRIKNDKNHYIT